MNTTEQAPCKIRGPGYLEWLLRCRRQNAMARRLGFRNYREWQGDGEE